VRSGGGVGRGGIGDLDVQDVGPTSEVGGQEFFDDAHVTFAVVVVVGYVECGRADGEDVVGSFDEGIADAADVFGGGGTDLVAEDFDLGLRFVGPGGVPQICSSPVKRVGEMVYCEDVQES